MERLSSKSGEGTKGPHKKPRMTEDRAELLRLVRENENFFNLLSEKYQDDEEFALAALECPDNTQVLRDVSDRLRNNRDFVLDAVKRNYKALKHAGYKWRADKAIVLAAMAAEPENKTSSSWRSVRYATKELRSDREFMVIALQLDAGNLVCASEDLKNDREIVLTAAQYCQSS